MSDVLYPDGYGTSMLTLEQLEAKHGPRMHPEYRRRLFPYLASKKGRLGIGGGFRYTQPVKPGFADDGKSFHQAQQFASGFVGYCAVDLVAPDGPDGNFVNDGVKWADTADAHLYGLHTFIGRTTAWTSDDEPWHLQPIEIRGWSVWVNTGRQDPRANYPLPVIAAPAPAPAPSLPNFGLYPYNANKATVSYGSTGDLVVYLQRVLAYLHETGRLVTYVGAADGQFGSKTLAAVRELQAANGLVVDGYVGRNTWAIVDWVALNG